MKVFAISDLHLSISSNKPMDRFGPQWEGYWEKIVDDWISKVSEEDVVVIAGDISWAMNMKDALDDFNEIAKLPGKKIILKGNHDYWWSSIAKLKNNLPKDFYIVQNNCVRIENCLFCGSRLWTISNNLSEDDKKILNREYLRLKMSLDQMKKERKEGDRVIGITHFPPFDVLDQDKRFVDLFSEYKVDNVVYGHLHGKDCRATLVRNINGSKYYLTSCDQISNKLVKIL